MPSEDYPELKKENLPKHIAVIMDGNGRWANKRDMPRVSGHHHGVEAVREIVEGCAELGISYLTLYAFSIENWSRPPEEVDALMSLLVETIHQEINTLQKNNIKLHTIGETGSLPPLTAQALLEAIDATSRNTGLLLTLALNYSGRWEILNACKKVAQRIYDGEIRPDQVDENLFQQYLSTAGLPDPDLLIRTSGENRLSNFLLWQLAYAEFIFLPIFWPDFRKSNLHDCLREYQQRERRFGLTGEQLKV